MATPRVTHVTPPGGGYDIQVIGEERERLRDFYHLLLRSPWWLTIAAISGTFLCANALFATAYLLVGGVAHAQPGSFSDAFFFSVETMGTIGYGVLSPDSMAANVLMVVETLTSLTLTALSTGLVFAKFSRSQARLMFSKCAVISPLNGAPTLMFRIGNRRSNQIVDTKIRVGMVRTEVAAEDGRPFYRMLDLKLQRDRALSLSRSWTVLHRIDADSPFHGETPESLRAKEVELQVLVLGVDDILMQTVHAQHRYFSDQIVWGARMADVLSEAPNGDLILDLRRFHDVEATAPTEAFPYPAADRGP